MNTTWSEFLTCAKAAEVFYRAEYSGITDPIGPAPNRILSDDPMAWPGFYVVAGQNEGWLIWGIEHRTDKTALVAKFIGPIADALDAAHALTRRAYRGPQVYSRHVVIEGGSE